MSQAQQPEALRLRLAAEGHIALCKKFGPEGFHFDADPQDVLAILARVQDLERWQEKVRSNSPNLALMERAEKRVQELETELASERRHSGASNAAAVRTLAAMGYSWHGGEQWKPPVTQALQERKPLGPYGLQKLIQKLQSELGVWNHGDLVQAVEIHHGIGVSHGIQEKHG